MDKILKIIQYLSVAMVITLFLLVSRWIYFTFPIAYISDPRFFFLMAIMSLIGMLIGLSRHYQPPGILLIISIIFMVSLIFKILPFFHLYSINLLWFGLFVNGFITGKLIISKTRFIKTKPDLFIRLCSGIIVYVLITIIGVDSYLLILGIALIIIAAEIDSLKSIIEKIKAILPDILKTKKETALPLFLSGLHFGLLQVTVFFIIQVYVTATFVGYFAVLIAWMLGVIINMKYSIPNRFRHSIIISILAYYLLLIAAKTITPYYIIFPAIGLLVLVTAFPAGSFFRNFAPRYFASSLFFHENNGFVLGFIISIVGFVKWGVHYLYYAPVISLILLLLTFFRQKMPLFLLLLLSCTFFYVNDNQVGLMVMMAILIIAAVVDRVQPNLSLGGEIKEIDRKFQDIKVSSKTRYLILFITGFNLILLQFFITRQFSTIMAATEITILIVGATYFAGFSIGYSLSHKISMKFIQITAVFMFVLHMIVILFIKYISGLMIFIGYGYEVIILLLITASFGTSSFYSIFLPKLIENNRNKGLTSAYSVDLLGAGAGSITMLILAKYYPQLLWPLYFLMFLVVVYILFQKSKWRSVIVLFGVYFILLITLFQTPLSKAVTEDYYHTRNYDNPALVYTANSFYQTIDVIETFRDGERKNRRGKWAFLNGILYFGFRYDGAGQLAHETGLSEFTYYLAELPAKYLYRVNQKAPRILILGCGSMYSIGRVSPYSEFTTMVDIDEAVIKSAKKNWQELNRYDQWNNYELIVDDAKHFLRTSNETYDLIIMDISAPYTLGTMLLHNKDFFEIIKSRLNKNGIFAESTQGRPIPEYPNEQGMKILASAANVFPEYYLLDQVVRGKKGHGYIYASNDENLSMEIFSQILQEDKMETNTKMYSKHHKKFNIQNTKPFSLTNMETLLSGNYWRFEDQLGLENRFSNMFVDNKKRKLNQLKTLKLMVPDFFSQLLQNRSFIVLNLVVLIISIVMIYKTIKPNYTRLHSKSGMQK